MILPSKHLSPERSLLSIGAKILLKLYRPRTISNLYRELVKNKDKNQNNETNTIRYEEMILALDLLFMTGAIELIGKQIRKAKNDL